MLSFSWLWSHKAWVNLQKVLDCTFCNTLINHHGKIFLCSYHNRKMIRGFSWPVTITFPYAFENEHYISPLNMTAHQFSSPLCTLLCSKPFILIDLRKVSLEGTAHCLAIKIYQHHFCNGPLNPSPSLSSFAEKSQIVSKNNTKKKKICTDVSKCWLQLLWIIFVFKVSVIFVDKTSIKYLI